MGENDFLRHLQETYAHRAAGECGIGDDCCVWTPAGATCLTVDSVVEGRHFTAEHSAAAVGRKAAAAALSDIAAMGARPKGAVVSLNCPAHWPARELMQALNAELRRHNCPLMGGDTTAANELVVSVTVWGEAVPGGRLIHRSGAETGDLLICTGHLGGSMAQDRHMRPEPRLDAGAWLAERDFTHAMMDISDGLGSDAPRLAAANDCGCILLPSNLPIHADVNREDDIFAQVFNDGEDYELLIAIDPAAWPTMQLSWPFDDVRISSIGWLVDEPGCFMEDAYGKVVPCPFTGFEHHVSGD